MPEYFLVTLVFVIQVEAEDPDSGSNGDVTYSFSSGASPRIAEMFSIDPTTGVITVKKSLEQSGQWDFWTFISMMPVALSLYFITYQAVIISRLHEVDTVFLNH